MFTMETFFEIVTLLASAVEGKPLTQPCWWYLKYNAQFHNNVTFDSLIIKLLHCALQTLKRQTDGKTTGAHSTKSSNNLHFSMLVAPPNGSTFMISTTSLLLECKSHFYPNAAYAFHQQPLKHANHLSNAESIVRPRFFRLRRAITHAIGRSVLGMNMLLPLLNVLYR